MTAHWSDVFANVPNPSDSATLYWAWRDAWEHIDLVELTLLGTHPIPQLTTGPACTCTDQPDIWCPRDDHARTALRQLGPPDCTCRDAHGWYPGRPDDPNCPVHGYRRTPPCTCRYGLYRVAGAPGPWIWVRRPGVRRAEPRTAAFRIDPRCEHHGELRRFDATYDGPGPAYCDVLDENERRGN